MADSQLLPGTSKVPAASSDESDLRTLRLIERKSAVATPRDTHTFPDTIELVSEGELPVDPGRYEILAEIGRGGMGVVYRGKDRELQRELAIKVLLDQHLLDPDQVRRFHKEAWIVGQLQHPGIVPLYDNGRLASGRPFFVMKLVAGRTLASQLNGRTDPANERPLLLKIFEQVCQTIAYAHSRGVIHRDLKPSNVMVGEFGEVQVMDWGLARVLSQSEHNEQAEPPASRTRQPLTQNALTDSTLSGDIIGTPAYMAPEQASGSIDLDERTDVFGLGAILCEILTGKPPYAAADATEALGQAILGTQGDTKVRLQSCGADQELIDLALRCLDPTPAQRPAHAGEVASALNAYFANVDCRVREAELERAAATARAREERKRRRLSVALGIAAVAVVVIASAGGIGVAYQRLERAEERARFERTQAAQRAETVHMIDRSLAEVARLQTQAKLQNDSLPVLARALAVARQAEQMLPGDHEDRELTIRVREALDSLGQAEQIARRNAADRRILVRLEEARLRQTALKDFYFDVAAGEPVYSAAFKEYGIDVEQLESTQASRLIADRPIRSELTVALLSWAIIRRAAEGIKDPLFQRLIDIAQKVDPDEWNQRFRDSLRKGDVVEFRKLANSVNLERVPPPMLRVLIDELVQARELPKAVELSRRAVRRHPSDFWLNNQCGFLLLDLQPPQIESSIHYLTAAVALRPDSPGARVNLGVALQSNGQYREAVDETREAIRLQPEYADAHNNLGINLLRLRQFPDAAAAFRRAVELKPNHLRARINLTDALIESGQFDAAIRNCLDLLKLDDNNKYALIDIARAYRGMGKLREAETAARRAIAIMPTESVAYYNLANMLSEQDRDEEALKYFDKSIELRKEHGESYCNKAHSLKKLGRFEEAHAAMKEGHRIGSTLRSWPYPSAQWLKETEALVTLDQRLGDLRAGKYKPVDSNDLLSLASFAVTRKNLPAVALDLYEAAFRMRPELETGAATFHRAMAIYAAATVSAQDQAAMRDKWLPRAVTWLKADLEWFVRESTGANRETVRSSVKNMLERPEWRPIRDSDQLARLPEKDRAALETHWKALRDLAQRLDSKSRE